MKTFDVYAHPTMGFQAVKQGFAWPAFFFTVIWAFVKRMWGTGFAMFGVFLLLSIVQTAFEQQGSSGGVLLLLLLNLGFYIMIGLKGNDWRRKNLETRGFEKVQSVQADAPEAAIAVIAKSVPSDTAMAS